MQLFGVEEKAGVVVGPSVLRLDQRDGGLVAVFGLAADVTDRLVDQNGDLLALLMLGYTIYRNVWPYPTEGPAQWFPVVAFGWLALVTVVMLAMPGVARKLAASLDDLDDSHEQERV